MKRRSQTFGWILGPLALGLASCGDVADVTPSELGVHTEMLEPSDLVGALDGRLMQFPCANSPSTDDCRGVGYVVEGVITACTDNKSDMVLDHPIGGTPGARYAMTMHLYGIMESKFFGSAVTREAAPGAPHRDGGTPTPWAQYIPGRVIPPSTYSAYEISVRGQGGKELRRYYVNADVSEQHRTLRIDYSKTIEVVGGGSVRLRRYDPNCWLIKNCGTTPGWPCQNKARTIDLSAANPPPPAPGPFPAGFNQPGLNQTSNDGGQWWFIDVTAVQAL